MMAQALRKKRKETTRLALMVGVSYFCNANGPHTLNLLQHALRRLHFFFVGVPIPQNELTVAWLYLQNVEPGESEFWTRLLPVWKVGRVLAVVN
jgi:hypothetical protein